MTNKLNKPRVLFIAPLPPPVHGSGVVSQQIKDNILINETINGDWVNMSTSRNMDEIGKWAIIKPFRLVKSLIKTLWLLIIHHYDLCYLAITCHGSAFLKDAPFVLLCKLFCKRIIIHQHNKGMYNDIGRWPYNRLLPLCYRNVKVILLSWRLYPDIKKVVPKENVMICPNGIKIPDDDRVIDNRKHSNRIPKILFLSNLMPSKGVFVLLDALKILADRGYSFQCNFVGGETKEIDAKRFAEEVDKRQLNRFVVYQGKKYGEEKEKAFENSDMFVFPTYNETFGLVNLEAMAHKLPIVSTNEGGIPDVVKDGENGLIAEPCNAESLAECIKQLIEDPILRKQMGEQGYQKLHEYFTEKVFEQTMQNILIRSVGGKFAL